MLTELANFLNWVTEKVNLIRDAPKNKQKVIIDKNSWIKSVNFSEPGLAAQWKLIDRFVIPGKRNAKDLLGKN